MAREWKGTDTSYLTSIQSHYHRHPTLKLLQALPHVPEHPTRAKILEFSHDGLQDVDIANLHHLHAYWAGLDAAPSPLPGQPKLSPNPNPPSTTCRGRLYLVEDISLPWISALGSRFTIDPRFFVEYVKFDPDRTQNLLEGYHTMRRLASLRGGMQFATFVYHEIRSFGSPGAGEVPRREEYEILTKTNVRRLVTTVDHHEGSFTGLVRRNLGVWWRDAEDADGAWDVIILVDAGMASDLAIRRWSEDKHWTTVTCPNTAYLGGYLDFSAWPPSASSSSLSVSPAVLTSSPYPILSPIPSTTFLTPTNPSYVPSSTTPATDSMLGDIATHFHSVSLTELTALFSKPQETPLFAYRIISSHWNLQLEYLVSVISDLEKGLLRFEQMDAHPRAECINQEVTALRVLLSDVNSWRRRVYFYLEQMLWNTEVLCLPPTGASEPEKYKATFSAPELADAANAQMRMQSSRDASAAEQTLTDFTQVRTHLLLTRERIQSLLPVVMGAFSLLEAQHSVLKADLTIRLSGVALVFVPLSFTASLLSMSDDFMPGKRLFWVYFVVSAPLILCLFWWAFWIQIGRGVRWSGRKLGRRDRRALNKEE